MTLEAKEGEPKDSIGPAIDFTDVFAQLQKYEEQHNGSLSIPASHPALSKIIDGLSCGSSACFETLSKKRWDEQLTALERFREKEGGNVNVPFSHPTLGKWVRFQGEQYRMHEQGMPNSLTKKRFAKLKAIGFDAWGSKATASRETSSDDGMVHENGRVDDDCNAGASTTSDKKKERKPKLGTSQILEGDSIENHSKKVLDAMKKITRKTKEVKLEDPEEKHDEEREENRAKSVPNRNNKAATVTKSEDITSEEREKIINGDHKRKATQANAREAPKPKGDNSEHRDETNGKAKMKKIKGKCDICEKSDGFWGHNLQQCKGCKILVHELCYGMAETDSKDANFTCFACKAVGTKIQVNKPSKIGGTGEKMGKEHEWLQVTERPTECVLCSHNKGNHAMHPLLDTYGPNGRQLVIDRPSRGGTGLKTRKSLAWVHTLCASVISANPRTAGSVYAADKHGNYYGCEEESCDEEEFDDDSKGSAEGVGDKSETTNDNYEKEEDENREELNEATASFIIASEKEYAKNIKDHRKLKCFICGKKDTEWRFPVQCIAGDENENERWKDRHPRGTECYMAMHVGCARWGCVEPEGSHLEVIDGKRCRLCFFTPGRDADANDSSKESEDSEQDRTVAQCFCKAHGRELVVNNPHKKRSKDVEGICHPADSKQQSRRKSAADPLKGSRNQPRNKSEAQSSFKKSLNSIRPRAGKKGLAQKRKRDTFGSSEVFFGAGTKKAKVKFAKENEVQYPSKGRSANALVDKRGPNPIPDMPLSTDRVKEDKMLAQHNDSTRQMSAKKRSNLNQNVPNGTRKKRLKAES